MPETRESPPSSSPSSATITTSAGSGGRGTVVAVPSRDFRHQVHHRYDTPNKGNRANEHDGEQRVVARAVDATERQSHGVAIATDRTICRRRGGQSGKHTDTQVHGPAGKHVGKIEGGRHIILTSTAAPHSTFLFFMVDEYIVSEGDTTGVRTRRTHALVGRTRSFWSPAKYNQDHA